MSGNVNKFCEALSVSLSRAKGFVAEVGEGFSWRSGVKTFTVYSMLTQQERESLFKLAKNTPLKKETRFLSSGCFLVAVQKRLEKGSRSIRHLAGIKYLQ